MNFYEIFVRSPVNGSAAAMVSYSGDVEKDITRTELVYLIDRLRRKRKLLDHSVGIRTQKHRKNLRYKINTQPSFLRNAKNARIIKEWCRNGDAIHRLASELKLRKDSCKHESKRDWSLHDGSSVAKCNDCGKFLSNELAANDYSGAQTS